MVDGTVIEVVVVKNADWVFGAEVGNELRWRATTRAESFGGRQGGGCGRGIAERGTLEERASEAIIVLFWNGACAGG